jgi:cholesterol transport system auxiliary component
MRGVLVCLLLLAGCASPPLTLYTLGTSEAKSEAPALGKAPMVIAVARVTIPDELDTEDIVVRDGSTLRRSARGRWGSRLSLGITDRLTERLGQRYKNAVVTARPLLETPSERVLVNIGRLDVTASGTLTMDADWVVMPREPGRSVRRDRAQINVSGPVATDQDVVTLLGTAVDRLAAAINVGGR